jgi:uncharacterized protein (TIGR03435 family)
MEMNRFMPVSVFILCVGVAESQVGPQFEVASVKVSQVAARGGEGSTREAVEFTPTSLSMRNVTLRTCVRWAYDVKEFQIVAPGRLTTGRYDILAKTSDPASGDRLRLMLRALLGERFKLTLHREVKELPVYALRATDRGHKLQRSKSEAPTGMRPKGGALEFHNISMAQLAERLPDRPFGLDRPVIDRTGLVGTFDFAIKIASDDAELKSSLERRESEQDTSLFVAPLRDIGLRLQPEKDRVEILVIDHAEKIPAEN